MLENSPESKPKLTPIGYMLHYGPGVNIIHSDINNKTARMLQVEERLGRPLHMFLIEEYFNKQKPLRYIAAELGIAENTTANWIRKTRTPLRSKRESGNVAWNNPLRKPKLIQQLHNPISDTKRSQSLKEYWENHPERKKKI